MTQPTRSARSARSGLTRLGVGGLRLLLVAIAAAVALQLRGLAGLLREQEYLPQGLWNLAVHTARSQLNERVPLQALELFALAALLLGLEALVRRLLPSGRSLLGRISLSRALASRALLSLSAALVLFAVAINAGSFYQLRARAPDSASVILIVVDTLRRDHLGAYGYPRSPSPNIDAFARQAVRFERAYSTSSWTRPAVASLLTSLSVAEHGISSEDGRERLGAAALTLPELLRQRNYRTAALVANPHYRLGLVQGFEFRWPRDDEGHTWADRMVDSALAFLRSFDGQPLFLLLHLIDPHDDYRYHPDFSAAPEASPYRSLEPFLPVRRGSGLKFGSERNRRETVRLAPAELAEMVANYDAEIAFADHHLGRLLEYLDGSGLGERSIVILTSDHGEEFLDHGSYWHGGTLYDELVQVPMLLRMPGRAAGAIDQRVSLLDLMPTLLDALAIAPPKGLQGTSLLPLLDGASLPPRALFLASSFRDRTRYALVEGRYKWIRFADGEPIGLFDLQNDPAEVRDLSSAQPERVKALEAILAERAEQHTRNARHLEPSTRFSEQELESLQQQLRALGYSHDPD